MKTLCQTAMTMVCVAVLLGAMPTPAGAQQVPIVGGIPTLAPILEKVTPAVVNIAVKSKAPAQENPLLNDPFFRFFFDIPQQEARPQISAGSGVIVDAAKGYVLTNHHVVANADQILVTLKDRRKFFAKLIGSDQGTDIALLQIKAERLAAVPIGDSNTLRVGDYVVAIGNPFGIGQTVTSGIVSALGRSGLNMGGYEDFIQTDASINPGNSGGALINLRGELVGINTAIIGPAGGNVGIGFAVPTRMANAVMGQLLRYGEVRRGRIGVSIQDVTPDIAEALKLGEARGAIVSQVEPKSPAQEAGIKAGDVILAVNGEPIRDSSDFRNRIGLTPVGETVRLALRRDGRALTVDLKIGGLRKAILKGTEGVPQLGGAVLQNLDRRHPLYGKIQGVVISRVERDSPAWQNGLRRGDVIVAVNRVAVFDVAGLKSRLKAAGDVVALNIIRDGRELFVVIR